MAAVAGIIRRDGAPVDQAVVDRMLDALVHRGPHGKAIRAFSADAAAQASNVQMGEILLGHRQLALDTSELSGLVANEAGTVAISFDGHIYNYAELRGNLERAGHSFQSHSDAEVLLGLYEHGQDTWLTAVDGVFAFALWDARRRCLMLARDRLGAKPLYYVDNERFVAFGSEIKALLAADLVRACLHPQALAEYFTFQNTYARDTVFKNVRIVLPGTIIAIEGTRLAEKRWFTLQVRRNDRASMNLDECSRELGALLRESVMQELPMHAAVGAYLSGGLDSATITALAAPLVRDFHTFTCGFDMTDVEDQDAGVDERKHAEEIAARYQTCHYSRVIRARDMALVLPRLVRCVEEPRLGPTYQSFYAAELASKFVGVVLGGIGGDELFAGYPWRNGPALECRSRVDFDAYCVNTYQRLVPERDWGDFFSAAIRREIADFSARDALTAVFSETDPEDDFLHRALLFEMRTSLHAQLLLQDKIEMAFSTDYRAPLLGNRLLDFALSLSPEFKLNDGTGKFVYRRAVEPLLPRSVVSAKKQGFCPPDRSWFRRPTLSYIRDIILSERALAREVFSRKYLDRILHEHVQGSADHRLLIWSLLFFETWCRVWMDGEG